jgi:hypothetical protein
MKMGNDPVVGETKREARIVMEWDHPTFFLIRITASLSRLANALIAASRFKAERRFGCVSC